MNVGDYARTNEGIIGKIIEQNEMYVIVSYKTLEIFVSKDEIIKSSSNIIDLIEVGDYVNESYIQEIKEIENNEMTCMLDSDYECYSHIKNEDIKSIVTKEQFETMQYKVGE